MRLSPTAIVKRLLCAAVIGCTLLMGAAAIGGEARLSVLPPALRFTGTDLEHGLLVTLTDANGQIRDVTHQAKFTSGTLEVVTVGAKGACRAVAEGRAEVHAVFEGLTATIPVQVEALAQGAAPSFRQDILPIITKTGCNSGGCHGKLAGQNGFRLSLRGYAAEWDHEWITQEVSARRINAAFPEQSLLLQKPAGDVVHEGGVRFKKDSRSYRALADWVAARAPGPVAGEGDATRLEVLPGGREMRPGDAQQLLVRAHYADGRVRDVTWLAQFFSNDEATVAVKPTGVAKALRAGETSVRVHFQGLVEVVRCTIPYDAAVAPEQFAARQNAIDDAVFTKLQGLRIPPSPPCDDATFLRRAQLDTTGALPSAEEVTAFLQDTRPDKRARLVDALLARPEWVDYWTLQLSDVLQNRKERDQDVRGAKGVRAFHSWLRAQVAGGKPWSEIARSVLLSEGDAVANPGVGYFITTVGQKEKVEESELPDSVAQSFLGTRIGCARCHNHPLERYTQDDFYHFSAFFSKLRLDRKDPSKGTTVLLRETRDQKEAGKRLAEAEVKLDEAEAMLVKAEDGAKKEAGKVTEERRKKVDEARRQVAETAARAPGVQQPRTNQRLAPRTLNQEPWSGAEGSDPRQQFVTWMLAPENPLFSGAMVNRLWKHFFSVGLVEPVDDLRASNPPSNPELWALLNREFTEHGHDLKHVMRLILNSRAYSLASATTPGNERDSKFYSHYYARRLPAEVLADAYAGAAGVPTAYAGYPLGMRAVQVADPGVTSYFLSLFGRSERVTACACERQGEVTLPQLLHLKNSDDLQQKIGAGEGRLAELLKQGDDAQVVRDLFLATLSREPGPGETAAIAGTMASGSREEVFRDLFWALLNSKEFTFNH